MWRRFLNRSRRCWRWSSGTRNTPCKILVGAVVLAANHPAVAGRLKCRPLTSLCRRQPHRSGFHRSPRRREGTPRERGRPARILTLWPQLRFLRCCRQPPRRREPHRPSRSRAMAPYPGDPGGESGRGCAGLCAGGTPALPGNSHCGLEDWRPTSHEGRRAPFGKLPFARVPGTRSRVEWSREAAAALSRGRKPMGL